jgi:hypothetical protein
VGREGAAHCARGGRAPQVNRRALAPNTRLIVTNTPAPEHLRTVPLAFIFAASRPTRDVRDAV